MAFVILTIIIAYYFVPNFSHNVIPLLKEFRPEYVFLALAATLAHFFAEVSRWWVYLRKGNGQDSGLFSTLLGIFSITALVTYLLPAKLGLPLRAYLLTSRLRLRLSTVTAYLVLDGVMAYGTWILLGLVFYLIYGESLPIERIQLLLIAVALVLMFGYLFRRRLHSLLIKLRGQFSLFPVSGLYVVVAILLLDIAGYVARHAAILAAMNIELALPLIAYATIVSIAAGFISMLPMGLGAYDVALIFLLTTMGIPLDSAVLVPLLNRAANIAISIALGLPTSYVMGESLFSLATKSRKHTGVSDI